MYMLPIEFKYYCIHGRIKKNNHNIKRKKSFYTNIFMQSELSSSLKLVLSFDRLQQFVTFPFFNIAEIGFDSCTCTVTAAL